MKGYSFKTGLFKLNMETATEKYEVLKINTDILALHLPKSIGKETIDENPNVYAIRGEEGDFETIEKTVEVDLSCYILIRPEDIEKLTGDITEVNDIQFTNVMMTCSEFMTANFDRTQF